MPRMPVQLVCVAARPEAVGRDQPQAVLALAVVDVVASFCLPVQEFAYALFLLHVCYRCGSWLVCVVDANLSKFTFKFRDLDHDVCPYIAQPTKSSHNKVVLCWIRVSQKLTKTVVEL